MRTMILLMFIIKVGRGLWWQWTFEFSETTIKVCSKCISWHIVWLMREVREMGKAKEEKW